MPTPAQKAKQIRFGRVLRLNATGDDVRAVSRALARAGYGTLTANGSPTFNATVDKRLRRFQADELLKVDGEYGPGSHAALTRWFDARSRALYLAAPKPTKAVVTLPEVFKSTHPTGGLDGYPAVDVFEDPGTLMGSPCAGKIDVFSGHDPAEGGDPGGAYGWSIYVKRDRGGRYYLTHFGTRVVKVGQRVKRGDPLGTVCDSAVSGKPNTSHIHSGYCAYC